MSSTRSPRGSLPAGRVVIVSPHLDDGILSLGAATARAVRNGTQVTMLTVFAGDPSSTTPAGKWDRRAGFETAGEAARTRRIEDAQACATVGAVPVWLPFGDEQYPRGGDESEVWSAVAEVIGSADAVLVPGSPLKHDDHRWLHGLAEKYLDDGRLGLYLEQPYTACLPAYRRALGGATVALRASLGDRRAKARACRAYRSQLPWFGRFPILKVLAYEARKGGEAIAWGD